MSEIAGTLLALTAQRVVGLMHRDFLQASPRSRDAYVAVMGRAGNDFDRQVGQLFYNSLLSDSDFAQAFASHLPREFESLLWPEIRRQLATNRECELANLGLFRSDVTTETKESKLRSIEFRPDPLLAKVKELRLPSINDANEREVVQSVHRKITQTLPPLSEFVPALPRPTVLDLTERIIAHTLKTVVTHVNQSANLRAATKWAYLLAEARAVAYVAYYAYLAALATTLSHQSSFIVPAFGTFRRDGNTVIFSPHNDFFDLVSANLDRSEPWPVKITG
ncbi:MAG: hypothetical protein DMG96_40535 [Acidobacteria bacterium]|nr:MAG: hypothetical protein DMG96_40535 [Acidobacteriota bacterium]HEU0048044.1 hypothetical protein [Nitrososphaera sp.]